MDAEFGEHTPFFTAPLDTKAFGLSFREDSYQVLVGDGSKVVQFDTQTKENQPVTLYEHED